jgi:hypothetical protein
MENQLMEFVFNKERYEYLKERLGDKISFVSYYKSEFSNEDSVVFTFDAKDKYDILNLFHAGIAYGVQVGIGKITE